jgi:hypothetical protein
LSNAPFWNDRAVLTYDANVYSLQEMNSFPAICSGRIARVQLFLASARSNYLQPPAASINEPVIVIRLK